MTPQRRYTSQTGPSFSLGRGLSPHSRALTRSHTAALNPTVLMVSTAVSHAVTPVTYSFTNPGGTEG